MSARRCTACGITYPASYTACEVCGGDNLWLSNVEADPDWAHEVDLKIVAEGSRPRPVLAWRREVLARLGFAGAVLDVLVDADTDLHVAADLVAAGCPVETAAKILI